MLSSEFKNPSRKRAMREAINAGGVEKLMGSYVELMHSGLSDGSSVLMQASVGLDSEKVPGVQRNPLRIIGTGTEMGGRCGGSAGIGIPWPLQACPKRQKARSAKNSETKSMSAKMSRRGGPKFVQAC